MKCVVYKGSRKADTYLYIEKEDDFSRVPQSLLDMLGRLEKVLHVELAPERKLANADAAAVREWLTNHGYYLQMPPKTELNPSFH